MGILGRWRASSMGDPMQRFLNDSVSVSISPGDSAATDLHVARVSLLRREKALEHGKQLQRQAYGATLRPEPEAQWAGGGKISFSGAAASAPFGTHLNAATVDGVRAALQVCQPPEATAAKA